MCPVPAICGIQYKTEKKNGFPLSYKTDAIVALTLRDSKLFSVQTKRGVVFRNTTRSDSIFLGT